MKRAVAVLSVSIAACSCSGPSAAPPSCPGATSQRLVNGVAQETYLGVSQNQSNAIVQVVDSAQPNGALCSGTFVAPEWVVTAQHCLQITAPAVVVQGDAHASLAVLSVTSTVANPTEDVALLHVDVSSSNDAAPDGGLAGVIPISAEGTNVGPLAVGDVVELAGYGVTETGSVRSLRFLAESIVGLDLASITVSGFGATGACAGDSGGPLLVRASDGTLAVVGVLSDGSGTCLDEDTYARLDGIHDWIESVIGSYASVDKECGTITEVGRCLYGVALSCSGTEIVANVCAAGEICGWDTGQAAFRCVDPSSDPCAGVDSVGACQNGAAEWCNGGVLETESCGPCGTCRVDGQTGSPECRSGSEAE